MSGSETEQSKADKKREYNRNAQRVFRQRRKEHLKNLEAAQRAHSGIQTDEIERLRQQNIDLLQENELLKRNYTSQSSSPAPTATSTSPDVGSSTYATYPLAGSISAGQSALSTMAPMGMDPSQSVPQQSQNLCVVMPHSITDIRRALHTLFAPLLDLSVISSPQSHLTTLGALAPQLPAQLKPTSLQLSTPHHAYIDMIPSQSLRDRLISVGNAHANTFMKQVCTIACEIEDHGQMTIWGEDWTNEFAWEFSAPVLEHWGGWLLDAEWGRRANFWRRQRGAPVLPGWD
ncbi:MAG: hypothetical protein Q9227_002793 [Pyrenula ochraceoflavens]